MTTEEILQYYINKTMYWSEWQERYCYHQPHDTIISSWYNEARKVNKVPLTYKDFKWHIDNNRARPYTPWRMKGSFKWRMASGAKYQSKPHHEKKELSEVQLAKKSWREHKKLRKDKAKSYCNRTSAPKWIKRYSNKMHRNWEQKMVSSNRHDSMGEKDYKYFLDPWMWD